MAPRIWRAFLFSNCLCYLRFMIRLYWKSKILQNMINFLISPSLYHRIHHYFNIFSLFQCQVVCLVSWLPSDFCHLGIFLPFFEFGYTLNLMVINYSSLPGIFWHKFLRRNSFCPPFCQNEEHYLAFFIFWVFILEHSLV